MGKKHTNKRKPFEDPEEAMGNTLKPRLEHAEKTGVCSVARCQLKEFPSQLLMAAGKLRSLDMSDNKMRSLPDTMGQFNLLKVLSIANNKITKLPDAICELVKLETFNASKNNLSALPANFANLKALKTLNLSGNSFKKFPAQVCDLALLDMVDLSENKVSEMPTDMSRLNCSEVVLNQNQLSSVPDSISRCPRLKILRVQENCLPLDGIPPSILSESTVSVLAIEGNLFEERELHQVPGYEAYQERFTAAKKKMY